MIPNMSSTGAEGTPVPKQAELQGVWNKLTHHHPAADKHNKEKTEHDKLKVVCEA